MSLELRPEPQIEQKLTFYQDCEVVNQLDPNVYIPAREGFINDCVPEKGHSNDPDLMGYWAFAGLTMSGKSTIIGQAVQEIKRHSKIREWKRTHKRNFPLYYLSTATSNLVVAITDTLSTPRSEYGPRSIS